GSTVRVSVERSGNFFSPDGHGGKTSIESQNSANVPFRIRVTDNGTPVGNVELQLVAPFNAYLGTTDSNGTAERSLAILVPPQAGSFNIEVQATVGAATVSSGSVNLYQASTLSNISHTVTEEDVRSWGGDVFSYFCCRGDISFPYPEIFGIKGS